MNGTWDTSQLNRPPKMGQKRTSVITNLWSKKWSHLSSRTQGRTDIKSIFGFGRSSLRFAAHFGMKKVKCRRGAISASNETANHIRVHHSTFLSHQLISHFANKTWRKYNSFHCSLHATLVFTQTSNNKRRTKPHQ